MKLTAIYYDGWDDVYLRSDKFDSPDKMKLYIENNESDASVSILLPGYPEFWIVNPDGTLTKITEDNLKSDEQREK